MSILPHSLQMKFPFVFSYLTNLHQCFSHSPLKFSEKLETIFMANGSLAALAIIDDEWLLVLQYQLRRKINKTVVE
jgi:hypothetical protein